MNVLFCVEGDRDVVGEGGGGIYMHPKLTVCLLSAPDELDPVACSGIVPQNLLVEREQ